jgi:DNA-binding transcriptional MerR regulator
MLKIGDFSKVCQVSIKALRHWDSIGLLKPALTDATSGYRYYSIEQISSVNKITALRAMGLSLQQVAELMHDDLSTNAIRAMLRLKQVELRQQIDNAAAALTMIEARLRQIDQQNTPPHYEIALKSTEALPALSIRERLATMDDLVSALAEAYPYARQRDNTNLMAIFHDEGYETEDLDVEIAFVARGTTLKPIPLRDERTMTATTLPAVPLMATTVHMGIWLTLPEAYIQLGRWIEENAYQIIGVGREVFHYIDWEHDQKSTVTELQFPIVKRPA